MKAWKHTQMAIFKDFYKQLIFWKYGIGWTFSIISSKQIKLATRDWNQIVEDQKLFPDHMYFLRFEWNGDF